MPRFILFLFLGILFLSQVQVECNVAKKSIPLYKSVIEIRIHIERWQFNDADEKLIRLNVSSEYIEKIAGFIYYNDECSSDLLICYSSASCSAQIRLSILTGLWNEMKRNNDMDMCRLIVLNDTLSTSVINYQQASDEIKTEANEMRNMVNSTMMRNYPTFLKEAVINRNYQQNKVVQVLNSNVYHSNSSFSDQVYRTLIDEVFKKVATDDLIRDMCSNQNANQVVTAMAHLLKEVKRYYYPDVKNEMLIAECLKHLNGSSSIYRNLSEEKLKLFSSLKDCFSESVKIIYFNTVVLIRNTGTTAPKLLTSDSDLVLAENVSDKNYRAQWFLQKTGTEFEFKILNYYKFGERLIVGNGYKLVSFVSIENEHTVGEQSLWKIHSRGNKFVIMNVLANNYLCLGSNRNNNVSNVFVEFVYSNNCDWTFEKGLNSSI